MASTGILNGVLRIIHVRIRKPLQTPQYARDSTLCSSPCITNSATVEMFNTYSFFAQACSKHRNEGKLLVLLNMSLIQII